MRFVFASLLTVGLAGCTQTASGPTRQAALPEPSYAPAGPGCAAQIAHFREIIAYDRSTNRIAQGPFDSASASLAPAESACAAGRSGEAMAILRRTKSSVGYP